jgi:hypothetical protein
MIHVQLNLEVIMTAFQKRQRSSGPMFALLKGAAAAALTCSIAQAQPTPPAPPGQPVPPVVVPQQRAVQLDGSVAGYNFDPRGNYESLLLKSADKLTQVNFPPDAGGIIAQSAKVGDVVKISATPAMGMPDHGVYDLVALTPPNGQPLTIAGPDDWRVQHIDAAVKSLNYGRRGEVNGAILDSGDFVHLGPDGATLISLAVGQKLSIDGYARPSLTGHNVIEADSVNGTRVRIAPPPPPDGGPLGLRGPAPRPGDAPPPPPAPDSNPPAPPRP